MVWRMRAHIFQNASFQQRHEHLDPNQQLCEYLLDYYHRLGAPRAAGSYKHYGRSVAESELREFRPLVREIAGMY